VNERTRDGYLMTTDPGRVDVAIVHRWLAGESYWAAGREYDVVARSIAGSVPYSVLTRGKKQSAGGKVPLARGDEDLARGKKQSAGGKVPLARGDEDLAAGDEDLAGGDQQVAFARVVTDGATFAWICDVFVDAGHRGRGLGGWLVDAIVEDFAAAGVLRLLLATRDAHEVYRRSGFEPLEGAQRFMEIDRRPTREAILSHLESADRKA
jgi:GNAT superfamily N-acetyltransferase